MIKVAPREFYILPSKVYFVLLLIMKELDEKKAHAITPDPQP